MYPASETRHQEDLEMTLENKVGWVTGGASGLGEATVRRLAEEGAAVVVADVDKERGDQLTTELQEKGQRVAFVEANVTDPNDVDGLVRFTVDTFGGLN